MTAKSYYIGMIPKERRGCLNHGERSTFDSLLWPTNSRVPGYKKSVNQATSLLFDGLAFKGLGRVFRRFALVLSQGLEGLILQKASRRRGYYTSTPQEEQFPYVSYSINSLKRVILWNIIVVIGGTGV